jgi:prohibitin 2
MPSLVANCVLSACATAALKKMKPENGGPFFTAIKGLLGMGAVGYGAYNALYTVNGGHRAVIFDRLQGVLPDSQPEGTHFMVPWFQHPIIFDVRTRPRNIQSLTGSRDLQMVNITLRVLSKPDSGKLPEIYRNLGLDYDERVLPSIVNEVTKQIIAKYNASQLITQREQVSRLIRRDLMERAASFNILLEDVSITHLNFGREYTAAVEAKQVAQQDAERAKFIVEKALQEKKSTIIKAQGEARAAEMVSAAIESNPGFVQLRRIDAAKDISATMSRSANKVYLGSDSLLLNLMAGGGGKDLQGKK